MIFYDDLSNNKLLLILQEQLQLRIYAGQATHLLIA
jgi:hypothetical protein